MLCVSVIHSQEVVNTFLDMPKIIPQSPEAASLLRFEDTPVNECSGTADISIPLFTLPNSTLQLPFVLRYCSSGIRVSEASGWTGLGWSLNLGGIARQQVGALDSRHTAIPADWTFLREEWLPQRVSGRPYQVGTGFAPLDAQNDDATGRHHLSSGVINDSWFGDGEKDVFCLSLPNGKSCRFVFERHETVNDGKDYEPFIIGDREHLKIYVKGSSRNEIHVYDTDGSMYVFTPVNIYDNVPMSYILSKIVETNRDETQITYQEYKNYNIPILSETYAVKKINAVKSSRILSGSCLSSSYYPSMIKTKLATVHFHTHVVGKHGPLLDSITVVNNFNGERNYKDVFSYDTFSYDRTGGSFLDSSDLPDYCRSSYYNVFTDADLGYRAKLTSVTRYGSNDDSHEHFSLDYDSQPLPLRTSFAQDFWGYYNGESNNSSLTGYAHTLISNGNDIIRNGYVTYNIMDDVLSVKGAVRNVSQNRITTGMLTGITFPTGGNVKFSYEPNSFSNHFFPCIEDRNKLSTSASENIFVNNSSNENKPKAVIKIDRKQKVKLQMTLVYQDYELYQVSHSNIKIQKVYGESPFSIEYRFTDCASNNRKTCTVNKEIELSSGVYEITGTLVGVTPPTDSFSRTRNLLTATITYTKQPSEAYKNFRSYGGGVRIREITYLDSDNNVQKQISYKYDNNDGKSTGVLLRNECNVEDRVLACISSTHGTDKCEFVNNCKLYSTSVATASPLCALTVGYKHVTKAIYDKNSGTTTKEETDYECKEGTTFGEYMHYFSNINGKPLVRKFFDRDRLFKQVEYEYKIENDTGIYCNVNIKDRYCGELPMYTTGLIGLVTEPVLKDYPRYVIRMAPYEGYDINLTNICTREFFGNDTVVTKQEIAYDRNKQVIRQTRLCSDGASISDTFSYYQSHNGDDDFYRRMNLTGLIHTKTISKSGSQVTTVKTYFKRAADMIPHVQKTFMLVNGNESSNIRYDYDNYANVQSITRNEIKKTTYLWSYNNSYPVLCIKGADFSEISGWLSPSVIAALGNSTDENDIRKRIESIRSQLSSKPVTIDSFTYRPMVGINSITIPTGLTTSFVFDGLGRLTEVRDNNGYVKEEYDYNYIR